MKEINTEGGGYIEGDVNPKGDFVGRDKTSVVDNSVYIEQVNFHIQPQSNKRSVSRKQNKSKKTVTSTDNLAKILADYVFWSIPISILLISMQMAGIVFLLITGITDLIVLFIVFIPLLLAYQIPRFVFKRFYHQLGDVGFYTLTSNQRFKVKQELKECCDGTILHDYGRWIAGKLIETNMTIAKKRIK